jgi:hypothetical protein
LDEAGAKVVTQEMLEVLPTPEGLRLLHSPALVDGLAGGDVIRIDTSALCGFTVVSRGRNLAVVVTFPSEQQRHAAQTDLGVAASRLGGVCDGGPERVLVFTIPAAAGFPAVEAAFESVSHRYPGATWYFGNVYGPDKRPLGWWA